MVNCGNAGSNGGQCWYIIALVMEVILVILVNYVDNGKRDCACAKEERV